MSFKDHFSGHAADYRSFRPRYPRDLFAKLTALTNGKQLAWDCATGSGQAAVHLAHYFDRVVATDASAKQIANAETAPGITYSVAPAEASGLDAASVDLLTVAQAIHWFDLDAFAAEAERVLKGSGILAAWTYGLRQISARLEPVNTYLY